MNSLSRIAILVESQDVPEIDPRRKRKTLGRAVLAFTSVMILLSVLLTDFVHPLCV